LFDGWQSTKFFGIVTGKEILISSPPWDNL
jgi:hypothetical protein